MLELTHFIGGKAVAGTSGRVDDVFDPNTAAVQAHVPLAPKFGAVDESQMHGLVLAPGRLRAVSGV